MLGLCCTNVKCLYSLLHSPLSFWEYKSHMINKVKVNHEGDENLQGQHSHGQFKHRTSENLVIGHFRRFKLYQCSSHCLKQRLQLLRLVSLLQGCLVHCDCRGCWENHDMFCRRSGVAACPVRIRDSQKVPKMTCEMCLSVALKACQTLVTALLANSELGYLWRRAQRQQKGKGRSRCRSMRKFSSHSVTVGEGKGPVLNKVWFVWLV